MRKDHSITVHCFAIDIREFQPVAAFFALNQPVQQLIFTQIRTILLQRRMGQRNIFICRGLKFLHLQTFQFVATFHVPMKLISGWRVEPGKFQTKW